MKIRSLCLIFVLLLLALPLEAADLPKPNAAVPVDLEADQLNFDQTTGRYHALGHVRLSQGSLLLTCDQLWWTQLTGEAEASGDVRLSGPGELLSGEKITYNLQQGTGIIEKGEAYWQAKSLRLTGRRIERLGPDHFRITDGHFTVCDSDHPAWSLGSKQADVTIGRYLTAKHALVYVKDLPVFYLPYLAIPVKNKRESGFLMPRLGFSNRRGTEFSTAWYQVLGRNMDATFYLDFLSSLGTGTGLEYRYIFNHKQRGEFRAYSIFARQGSQRWTLDWQHLGQINESLRSVADVTYVSSRDYFSDFASEYGHPLGVYNRQKAINSLFLTQYWTKASLTGQLKYIKDLESSTSHPWASEPHVDFSVAPWRVAQTPLYFSLQSSYHNFTRDLGPDGQRLMVRPALEVNAHLFKGLEVNSEFGYRQRQYFQTETGQRDSSGNADASIRLASRVFRVYGEGRRSWLHSIEPEIDYHYMESAGGDGFPDFDRFDQANPLNAVGYAFVNRLTGKWVDAEGSVAQREVVWLKFSQDYDLSGALTNNSSFSDLRTQLILRPTTLSSVNFDTFYDVNHGRFSDFSIAGNFADERGNGMKVSYQKQRATAESGEVDNLNFQLNTALLKPLYISYGQRYDLLASKRLEHLLDLDYRQQCWGLKVSLREREAERSIMFSLSLGGLGEVGSFGRSTGG